MFSALILGTALALGMPSADVGPQLPQGAAKELWQILHGKRPEPLAALMALPPRETKRTIIAFDRSRRSNQEFSDSRRPNSSLGFADLYAAEGSPVLSNRGDRVVIAREDQLLLLKDDDVLLHQPGALLQEGIFSDGSIRSVVQRADGSQVLSIRDVTGRLWRRIAYDKRGQERVLIDDLREEEKLYHDDIAEIPFAEPIYLEDRDPAMINDRIADQAQLLGRKFTAHQLRQDPHLRALLPSFEVENITFANGSAVIEGDQARNLADLGGLLKTYLEDDPSRIFLVEGHSDSSGRESYNLLLSDRRAESLALALVEYFDIPPENLLVQGYGSAEPLGGPPEEDRRVTLRLISPLLALPHNQPKVLPPSRLIERR